MSACAVCAAPALTDIWGHAMCATCAGAWFADPLLSLSALRVSDSDAEELNRRYAEVTPKWIARRKARLA